VPFFVVDGHLALSGAQPPELLAKVLQRAWDETHPTIERVDGAAEACGPDGCAL
jgi:predicted DsbA family dithiol-disulfide isomerase